MTTRVEIDYKKNNYLEELVGGVFYHVDDFGSIRYLHYRMPDGSDRVHVEKYSDNSEKLELEEEYIEIISKDEVEENDNWLDTVLNS